MSRLLDRKLRRDLRRHLGSLVAIAIVVACGVASFVGMRAMARVLADAQRAYYAEVRFPDLFARVRRAPDRALDALRAIPGVSRVEARVSRDVVLRVPGLREPATARLVGTHAPSAGALNLVVLRAGRRPLPLERDAVIASEGFASANGLAVGDTVGAVLGGRWRALRIVGLGVTAEFVYELRPGDMLPDARRYGVLWMDAEAAADALGYAREWNDLALTLAPGADPAAVRAALDDRLARYGTLGAYDRSQHASHRFLTEEIRQNATFAVVLPVIFLGVAAFLVHLVLGRVVQQQRDQVGTLKAFGFPSATIARHYVLFGVVPVAAGTLLGIAVGFRFTAYLAGVYADFFRFPSLRLTFAPDELVAGALIALGAAVLGALGAVRRVLALAPAESMRPEPPAAYAHGWVDRLLGRATTGPAGGWGPRSPVARMVARGLTHRPLRSALGALGVGLGASVVIAGTFGFDTVRWMRTLLFEIGARADVTVVFAEPLGTDALGALAALPGVTRVEPVREVAVRVRHGQVSRQTALVGVEPTAQLRQVVDLEGRRATVAASGVTLSATLGRVLRAAPGDSVDLEFLDGRGRRVSLPVAALVDDLSGLGVYVEAARLPALVGVGEVVTGADLAVDAGAVDALYDRLSRTPMVQAVVVRDAMRRAFDATLQRNFVIVLVTLVSFAAALAAGTVYNAGRVTLSERARDLASLRVLGFTRGEVARILFGELLVLAAVGLPAGLLIGVGFAAATVASFGETELFRMPLVIGPRTIAAGIAIPAAAAVLVAWPLRRRLDRLDLIGVLKTRE